VQQPLFWELMKRLRFRFGLFLGLCFGMPPTEPVGGDAALGRGKIRRGVTVRQVRTEGRNKKNLRTMKISAIAPTLSRFSTAESCPTTRWRAMA